MAIPKLFEAVSILNSDEWSLFGRHLLLYSREGSDNYKLYKALNKNRNKLSEEKYSEQLRIKSFKQMSPKVYSNMLSRVFVWLEEWLAIHTFKSEAYQMELMLNKAYNRRGLFKNADKVANKLESQIKKEKHLSLNQSWSLAELYHNQFFSSNPIKIKNKLTLLEDCTQNYMAYVTQRSLLYLLELENQIRINHEVDFQQKKILENLIAITHETELSRTLNLARLAIKKPELNNFIGFKEALKSGTLDPSSDLFLMLASYLKICADLIWHKALSTDASIFLEAYQLTFEAYRQNNNHKLNAFNLFNAVSFISTIIDSKETEKFINEWIDMVHTKYKDSALRFCNALNAFRHNNYEVLPKLLSGLEFDAPIYKYISGALAIIAQYELGEEALMSSMIQNYKKQLKRNRKTKYKLVNIKLANLIEVIILLNKSKYDKNVVIDIDKFSPCYYKSWVIKHL